MIQTLFMLVVFACVGPGDCTKSNAVIQYTEPNLFISDCEDRKNEVLKVDDFNPKYEVRVGCYEQSFQLAEAR